MVTYNRTIYDVHQQYFMILVIPVISCCVHDLKEKVSKYCIISTLCRGPRGTHK